MKNKRWYKTILYHRFLERDEYRLKVMVKTLSPAKKFSLTPYMFVLPFLVILFVFTIYPFIEGVRLSLLDVSGFGEGDFIGLQNFYDVLSDEIFWKSFWHTIQYMIFSVLVQVPISFLLAMVMNMAPGKLRAFLRVAFFIPVIISGVVAAIIFNCLFLREFGAINWLFEISGLPHNYGWLVEPNFAMPVVMTVGFWLYLGYHMVYLLSGLQTIDPVFYESAKIDGANWWQQQIGITIPLMRPALTFSFITSAIYSMQMFDLPFVLFDLQGASMNYAPSTLMTYVYEYAFKKFLIGQAAAAGWIIFAMVMVITLIQLKLLGFNKTEN